MAEGAGRTKWITAEKLIQLLSRLDPKAIVLPNDHYNLSLYEPEGYPEHYIGVVDIRTEQIAPR
jgi:hypothetical protein